MSNQLGYQGQGKVVGLFAVFLDNCNAKGKVVLDHFGPELSQLADQFSKNWHIISLEVYFGQNLMDCPFRGESSTPQTLMHKFNPLKGDLFRQDTC